MTIQSPEEKTFPHSLFRRLGHFAPMSDRERQTLCSLTVETREVGPHKDLITEGEDLKKILVVEQGWCIRHRSLADGRRQIFNFLMAGDVFDLQVFMARKCDHSVSTVTPVILHVIPPQELLQVFRDNSGLALGLWWATLQEEAILREQIVRTGQRSARERVAHMILELHRRSRLVNRGSEDAFTLPLTQTILADALGLSLVHVNRTLRTLIRAGLIERQGASIVIRQRAELQALCDFDTSYLHLDASEDHFRLKFPDTG